MTTNNHPQKVSIIIVTYNAAPTLQKCLDSIYAQTYPSLEIIVLDGASTDGTVATLEKNTNQIAYWKSEPDKGIYDAMNNALEHITGEWVYFMGADDELYADFSAFANQLKDHAHVYYGNVMFRGKKHRGEVNAYQHAKGAVCHQAVIYPKEVFTKKGMRFNMKYRIVADHELNMRCWRKFPFRYLDYTIALFNDTGVSSVKVDHDFKKDQLKLTFKYHGLIIGLRYAIRLWKEKRKPEVYKPAPSADNKP